MNSYQQVISKIKGSSEAHSVVSVEMYPISRGREPTIDAFCRVLCVVAIEPFIIRNLMYITRRITIRCTYKMTYNVGSTSTPSCLGAKFDSSMSNNLETE